MIRASLAAPIRVAGPDHAEIFATRCEIMADLIDAGQCDFHDGVDLLQAEAEANDLPELFATLAGPGETGQDVVQEIMAGAFRARTKSDVEIQAPTLSTPTQSHPPFPSRVASVGELQGMYEAGLRRHKENCAPEVTLDALIWSFCESGGDLSALETAPNKERLSRLSAAQFRELRNRMKRWIAHHA
jgi:hypothetical protein